MTYFPGLGVMIKPQKHLSHMQKGPYTLLLSHCHADTKKTLSMVFKVPKLWVHLSTKNSCKDVGISDIYFYKILQCAFQRLSLKHGEVQNNWSKVVFLETRKTLYQHQEVPILKSLITDSNTKLVMKSKP